MTDVFRTVFCEQLFDDRVGFAEVEAPSRTCFQAHMRTADVRSEPAVERPFGVEIFAVPFSDLRFFSNADQRLKNDAVHAGKERHILLPWRVDLNQHVTQSGSNGLVPDPENTLAPADLTARHLRNTLKK